MTNSAVNVRTLLEAVADGMWASFKSSSASARPDHKGGPREREIRHFLRERLPTKWAVTRGHVIYSGDRTSQEFDVIVYDAINCPSWALDGDDDPRRLVPLEAVVGIIEVKSTLNDKTLAEALKKIHEFDEMLNVSEAEKTYRPFRYVFAYRLDANAKFNDWGTPNRVLTKYAGALVQPDGLFILNSEISVLDTKNSIGLLFALHRGQSVNDVLSDSWDIQNEQIYRDIHFEPSYCNDYFTTPARDGLLLLAFLTFVINHASSYRALDTDYADIFCRWGGPRLGGLL